MDEMERRYELLSKSGVRDISSYNAKVEIELGKRAERKSGKVTAAPVMTTLRRRPFGAGASAATTGLAPRFPSSTSTLAL